jgi:hypothetical protein
MKHASVFPFEKGPLKLKRRQGSRVSCKYIVGRRSIMGKGKRTKRKNERKKGKYRGGDGFVFKIKRKRKYYKIRAKRGILPSSHRPGFYQVADFMEI